jgi:hypothetical protein
VRDSPFPPLGCESDRIFWVLDHLGMHGVARDGLSLWLDSQQQDGALLVNSKIEKRHAVGALLLPWVYAEHYRLTGDKEWLRKEAPRLKAGIEWIIGRRKTSMKQEYSPEEIEDIKTGKLTPYGLQPAIASGDGGGRPFWMKDFGGYRSVKLLADVMADVDPRLGAELSGEAAQYRKDLIPVLDASLTLSPVIRTLDGLYHSCHPQGLHDRGPLARALPEGANIFSHCGPYSSDIVVSSAAMEAWLKTGVLSLVDPRVDGHFEVLEDVMLLDHPWIRKRKPDYDPNKDWFGCAGWGYQSGWERMADCYLMLDDIPNFLRSWLNHCAIDLNVKGWVFWEHTTQVRNDKSHGNAVFLSNFRNMLVMEIDDALWLARATPRAWLEQGKKIGVKNAPTCFGTAAYEIVSDVDNGKINATIQMPSRKAPASVILRFRHPKAAPIKAVTFNGQPSTAFNKDKETIDLKGLTGTVAVTAQY